MNDVHQIDGMQSAMLTPFTIIDTAAVNFAVFDLLSAQAIDYCNNVEDLHNCLCNEFAKGKSEMNIKAVDTKGRIMLQMIVYAFMWNA